MSAYSKLSPRNKAILENYLTGDTGAEAYHKVRPDVRRNRARDMFYKLKNTDAFKAALDEREAEIFAGTEVTRQRIIREMARVAFGNVKVMFRDDGSLRQVSELNEDEAAIIAGVDVEALYEGQGADKVRIGNVVKIKGGEKVRALEGLARIGGMNNDKKELSGSVNLTPPVVTFARYNDDDNNSPDKPTG